MATITRRRNPSGEIVFRVRVRIKGHRTVSETFARLSDAKEWGKRTEIEIRDGLVFGEARKTLRDAIERYLSEEIGKLAATERRNRVAQLAWWAERRGSELLTSLRRSALLEDLRRLRTGEIAPKGRPVTVATANRYGAALSAVLSAAVDVWEWLAGNPLHRASRRKKSKSEREVERDRELTQVERDRLLEACRPTQTIGKRKQVDARLYGLVVCALASGARQGELMGMEWKRVELRPTVYDPATGASRIGVPRATVVDTKNGSDRVLYFPGEAAEVLMEMARRRHLSRFVWSKPGMPPGAAPKFPTQAFRCAVRRAMIEDFHFHDLRHSWACSLLDSGANLAQLMTLGGWQSANMVRRYTSRAQRQGSTPVETLHTRQT